MKRAITTKCRSFRNVAEELPFFFNVSCLVLFSNRHCALYTALILMNVVGC